MIQTIRGKRKISEIFEEAIEYLSPDPNTGGWNEKEIYSCNAIKKVLSGGAGWQFYMPGRITRGLKNMGLRNPTGEGAFSNVPPSQRQQARALWLTWCALMAKEQGL